MKIKTIKLKEFESLVQSCPLLPDYYREDLIAAGHKDEGARVEISNILLTFIEEIDSFVNAEMYQLYTVKRRWKSEEIRDKEQSSIEQDQNKLSDMQI